MRSARQTQTRRTWRPPRPGATGRRGSGRRAAPRGVPFAGGRGKAATGRTGFAGIGAGRGAGRRAAGRRKQSGGGAGLVLGALGKRKQAKGSR
jgi:hypothetical protein